MNQQRRSRELERADQRAPVSQTNITKFESIFYYYLEVLTDAPFSFPGLFWYVYIKRPNLKKTRKPHTQGLKPYQIKMQTSKNPIPDTNSQNPNPKTSVNEKNEDIHRITLGKYRDRGPKLQKASQLE